MKKTISTVLRTGLGLVLAILHACSGDDSLSANSGSDDSSSWNIPSRLVVSGGVSKDGIPSLLDPDMIAADQATYLLEDNLVLGLVVDGAARAYPYPVMDWHEVANEDLGGKKMTISYCPLTGTGIVFDGGIGTQTLSFGVSGLLFNNNLIMFDRQTDSHWPQMRLQSDEGELRNTKLNMVFSIETTWSTWKKLFPNTRVLSPSTGFDRPYADPNDTRIAYPGYRSLFTSPLFPVEFLDQRLPPKQKIHGVLSGSGPGNYTSKAYVIKDRNSRLINDTLNGTPLLVLDAGRHKFVVSYEARVDGQNLTFELDGSESGFPFTYADKETGSTWNLMGEAVDGPMAGKKLGQTRSYNAYWFAWGTFHKDAEIIE